MKLFLLIIEIISGLLMIGAILLHSPKNEGMGALGGQSRTFAPPTNDIEKGLKRITIILVILFFGSALILGLFY